MEDKTRLKSRFSAGGFCSRSWIFTHTTWNLRNVAVLCLCLFIVTSRCVSGKSVNVCSAVIDVTYRRPGGKDVPLSVEGQVDGRYGLTSRVQPEHGRVVHVMTALGYNDGCSPAVNSPSDGDGHWIALVQRGGCRFGDKVLNTAMVNNATAVVVYNDQEDDELITMNHDVDDVVSVFIKKKAGEHIAELVESGLEVYMNISIGYVTLYEERTGTGDGVSSSRVSWGGPGNTPVLVVSLCIIVALIAGLVALLVYGIRRSRRNQNGNRSRHRSNSGSQRSNGTSRHVVFLMPNEHFQTREGLLADIAEQCETASTDTTPVTH